MLRNSVYTLLGVLDHQLTVDRFFKIFKDHVNSISLIDTDLRNAVYATVCTHGDENTLNAMKGLYMQSDVADEHSRLLRNMGRFADDQLREEVLQFSISVSRKPLAFSIPRNSGRHLALAT